ncbi:MAG: hypothetical protein U0136_19775 [Bdellovibrionota bacterium]
MAVPLKSISFSRCHAADLLADLFPPGVTVYQSPAAESLFKYLGARRRSTVLDFGPLIRDNVELLTAHYCKLFVEDFHQGLPDERLSMLPDSELDVVLCWDLFNYLEVSLAKKLMHAISSRMTPNGVLMMHLASGQRIPKRPLHFRLADRSHISCEATCRDPLPHAALTARALQSLMTGWKPEHSLQLRNEFQEHLFVREPG